MEARHDLQHRPRQQARTTKDTDKEKKLGFWKIRTGKKQYTRGHAPYRGCINIRMTLVRRIARERERERESLETVRETKHMEKSFKLRVFFLFLAYLEEVGGRVHNGGRDRFDKLFKEVE